MWYTLGRRGSSMGDKLLEAFRGSVLEELLMAYTLPGVFLLAQFILLLDAQTADHGLLKALSAGGVQTIAYLVAGWFLATALGYILDSLHHNLDRFVDPWLAPLLKRIHYTDVDEETPQLRKRLYSGEQLRTRYYLAAETYGSLMLVVAFAGGTLPYLLNSYGVPIGFAWAVVIYSATAVGAVSLALNWASTLIFWKKIERLAGESQE